MPMSHLGRRPERDLNASETLWFELSRSFTSTMMPVGQRHVEKGENAARVQRDAEKHVPGKAATEAAFLAGV